MSKVFNPDTNKYVDSSKRAFKTLLKRFDYTNGVLVPKNKDGYLRAKTGVWIKSSKLPNKYVESENLIIDGSKAVVLARGYALSPLKKPIKINSRVFHKWIRSGYDYVPSERTFKPRHVNKITITRSSDIVKLVDDMEGVQYVVLSAYDISSNKLSVSTVSASSKPKLINMMFNVFYDDEVNEVEVHMYESNPEVIHGPLFDGEVNCFVKLIQDHLKDHKTTLKRTIPMLEEYADGVFADDIEGICDKLKLPINVYTAGDKISYGKSHSHGRNKVLNVRVTGNHAIEYFKVERQEPEYVYIQRPISLFAPENEALFCAWERGEYTQADTSVVDSLVRESADTLVYVHMCGDDVVGYQTNDKIVKYDYDDVYTLDNTEYTFIDKAYNELLNLFTTKPTTCKFEVDLCHAIHFSKAIRGEHQMLDLKSAYNHYPDRLPGDIKQVVATKSRLTATSKGQVPYAFYLVKFMCPIEKRAVLRIISEEVLNVLEYYKINHQISQAYVSSYTTSLDAKPVIDEYSSRTFHKILGRFQRCEASDTFITDHYEEAIKYGGRPIAGTNLHICERERRFTSHGYYPHIAGAIIQYTTARLYETVLEHKFDVERAWVDSLVFKQGYKIPVIPEGYSIKTKDYVPTSASSDSASKSYTDTTEFVDLPSSKVTVIYGSAGTGKSYQAKKILHNIPSAVLLAPTNLVASMYGKNGYTIDAWISNTSKTMPYKSKDLILIDEFSMVDVNTVTFLMNMFKDYRFILFGDSKQLSPVNGKAINIQDYPNRRLTKIYRQTDKSFLTDLQNVYSSGNPLVLPTMSVEDGIKLGARFVCCLNSHVDSINRYAYKVSAGEVVSDELKTGMPAYVNTNEYKRKLGVSKNELCTILTDKLVLVGNTEYSIPAKKCKPATAITCHKLQGQTVEKTMVVHINGIDVFGDDERKRMLYTMYSRVRKRSQLYCLERVPFC